MKQNQLINRRSMLSSTAKIGAGIGFFSASGEVFSTAGKSAMGSAQEQKLLSQYAQLSQGSHVKKSAITFQSTRNQTVQSTFSADLFQDVIDYFDTQEIQKDVHNIGVIQGLSYALPLAATESDTLDLPSGDDELVMFQPETQSVVHYSRVPHKNTYEQEGFSLEHMGVTGSGFQYLNVLTHPETNTLLSVTKEKAIRKGKWYFILRDTPYAADSKEKDLSTSFIVIEKESLAHIYLDGRIEREDSPLKVYGVDPQKLNPRPFDAPHFENAKMNKLKGASFRFGSDQRVSGTAYFYADVVPGFYQPLPFEIDFSFQGGVSFRTYNQSETTPEFIDSSKEDLSIETFGLTTDDKKDLLYQVRMTPGAELNKAGFSFYTQYETIKEEEISSGGYQENQKSKNQTYSYCEAGYIYLEIQKSETLQSSDQTYVGGFVDLGSFAGRRHFLTTVRVANQNRPCLLHLDDDFIASGTGSPAEGLTEIGYANAEGLGTVHPKNLFVQKNKNGLWRLFLLGEEGRLFISREIGMRSVASDQTSAYIPDDKNRFVFQNFSELDTNLSKCTSRKKQIRIPLTFL